MARLEQRIQDQEAKLQKPLELILMFMRTADNASNDLLPPGHGRQERCL
jgi:hypothetical protein